MEIVIVADVVKDAVNQANTPFFCYVDSVSLFFLSYRGGNAPAVVCFRPSISKQEAGGLFMFCLVFSLFGFWLVFLFVILFLSFN